MYLIRRAVYIHTPRPARDTLWLYSVAYRETVAYILCADLILYVGLAMYTPAVKDGKIRRVQAGMCLQLIVCRASC